MREPEVKSLEAVMPNSANGWWKCFFLRQKTLLSLKTWLGRSKLCSLWLLQGFIHQ